MGKYYLAYGSNLDITQMRVRCPSAIPVGTAEIKNCKLEFRGATGCAYLTLSASEGDVVPLGVWLIKDEKDEKNLDKYEGYPHLYRKVKASKVRVKTFCNEPIFVDAFLYLMSQALPIKEPSLTYIESCRRGYKDFGLPLEALNTALKQPTGGVS